MPRLACQTCGREVFAVAPLDALRAEERRCPRCGMRLEPERRARDRRRWIRRANPSHDPGPPAATGERRTEERRTRQRRR